MNLNRNNVHNKNFMGYITKNQYLLTYGVLKIDRIQYIHQNMIFFIFLVIY